MRAEWERGTQSPTKNSRKGNDVGEDLPSTCSSSYLSLVSNLLLFIDLPLTCFTLSLNPSIYCRFAAAIPSQLSLTGSLIYGFDPTWVLFSDFWLLLMKKFLNCSLTYIYWLIFILFAFVKWEMGLLRKKW